MCLAYLAGGGAWSGGCRRLDVAWGATGGPDREEEAGEEEVSAGPEGEWHMEAGCWWEEDEEERGVDGADSGLGYA